MKTWKKIAVKQNELASFGIYEKSDSFKVKGKTLFEPRFFSSEIEAIEFAEDKLLVIFLENELLVEA